VNAQAPAVADPKMADFRGMLARMKPQFEMALPRHMTAERLMRISVTACQKNPKLLDCTPKSVFAALMTAAQVGLEPDGTLGRAYLIPRKNNRNNGALEANFQIGYQGLLDLCYRTGDIASVRADVVRKGDHILFEKGLNEKLEHREGKDNFDAEITHVYAIIRTQSGGVFWDVWQAEKVEAHRRRFSKDGREDSVWNTDWASMAKKTLLISVMKYAPKSIETARAIEADDRGELDLPEGVIDVAPTKPAAPTSVADLREEVEGSDQGREAAAGSPTTPSSPTPPEPGPTSPAGAIPPRRRPNKPKEQTEPAGAATSAPADDRTAYERLASSLLSEVNSLRDQVGEELFTALLKKHGGELAGKGYSLGTDGLRKLRDELIAAT